MLCRNMLKLILDPLRMETAKRSSHSNLLQLVASAEHELASSADVESSKDPEPITTASAPAQTPATANSMKQAVRSQPDSRDISPMSKPIKETQNQTQPTVTTGP